MVMAAIIARPARPLRGADRLKSALDLEYPAFEALNARSASPIAYRELFSGHADLPARVTRWASEHDLKARALQPVSAERGGRSQKRLFALSDGHAIESVRIRRRDGCTACVSSQVGCAFACAFCASGQAGLKRNLSPGEIIEQVIRLGPGINRIVFMGIGEPLNNYDNVLRAIRIMRDRRGLRFPASGVTISTIGIPKALKALREEHLAINLTISLHATTQQTRDRLIPGARKHDIKEVVSRALSWAERHNRIVTFVYLLLPGVNDGAGDLRRLTGMLAGRPARVNLMRWNPVDGVALSRTNDRTLAQFRTGLLRAGVPAVVRDTQGRDSGAACGQLWLRDGNGRKLVSRT
jgi:23S rRNA (adenine2503-C2)-methyltransferase